MGFRESYTSNLPPTPDEALLVLADRAMDWLNAPDEGNSDLEAIMICSVLEAFIVRFRPEIIVRATDGEKRVRDYVTAIMRNAGAIQAERIIESYEDQMEDSGESFGRAELRPEEKKSLHEHLQTLREIIQSSDLSIRKKNGLFARLNALAVEVDRHGTRTDRFFAFASDLGFYMGDFAKKSGPVWKEVKDVFKIVTKARARDEEVALPPGEEILRLPDPSSGDANDKGEK